MQHQPDFIDDLIFDRELSLVRDVIQNLPVMALLLNKERRIILANELVTVGSTMFSMEEIFGQRPGDIFRCRNAAEKGCGNSENCQYCGIFKALNECLIHHVRVDTQSKLSLKRNGKAEVLEFNTRCTPIIVSDNIYLLLTLENLRLTNRSKFLEKVFFHDTLNIINGLKGLAGILSELNNQDELAEPIEYLNKVTDKLSATITSQRDLVFAENQELKISKKEISAQDFVTEAIRESGFLPGNENKKILIDPRSHDFRLNTDPVLLGRILVNMIKNALEADTGNPDITLLYRIAGNHARFDVHSYSYISDEVARQLFLPFFSTKGHYRGLGTYSMRLIGENYLDGKVYFNSHPVEGTTFTIELPAG